MSTPADFERRWQRDQHVVKAQQELARALGLVRSAAAKCERDPRTATVDFDDLELRIAQAADHLARAIGATPSAVDAVKATRHHEEGGLFGAEDAS